MRFASPFSTSLLLPALLLATCMACGCGEEAPEYSEVRRIDEDLNPDELQTFIRIVNQLPDHRLPDWPLLFQAPPQWKASRTLSIGELLQEEQGQLDQKWDVSTLAAQLKQNRQLHRVLHRERMTAEQFTGLTLSIGMALCANTLREEQDLKLLISRGEIVLGELRRDARTFSTLDEETRFHVLQEAVWLCRLQRANQLNLVPIENIQLVNSQREVISPMFPEEFNHNPLDAIADVLGSKGLPFEELPSSGFDDQITWNPELAVVGHNRVLPADSLLQPDTGQPADQVRSGGTDYSRASEAAVGTNSPSSARPEDAAGASRTPAGERQPVVAPRPATASLTNRSRSS